MAGFQPLTKQRKPTNQNLNCNRKLLIITKMEPMAGIEPATDGLRNRCSTAELHWLAQPNQPAQLFSGFTIRIRFTHDDNFFWRKINPVSSLAIPLNHSRPNRIERFQRRSHTRDQRVHANRQRKI